MAIIYENWYMGGVTMSLISGKPITYGKALPIQYKTELSVRSILNMYIQEMVEDYAQGKNMETLHEVYIR